MCVKKMEATTQESNPGDQGRNQRKVSSRKYSAKQRLISDTSKNGNKEQNKKRASMTRNKQSREFFKFLSIFASIFSTVHAHQPLERHLMMLMLRFVWAQWPRTTNTEWDGAISRRKWILGGWQQGIHGETVETRRERLKIVSENLKETKWVQSFRKFQKPHDLAKPLSSQAFRLQRVLL